ncbi:hypothetical protein [Streptomyces sp. NPDC096095]|uniref:hypothetical protein n=1 Tax=Streptomyces sp. NPDC096095 TaxID=3155545 RepID=UPI003328F165
MRSRSESNETSDNGTLFQRQIFEERAKEGRPEPALGFGDSAHWRSLDDPSEPPDTNCSLSVLDGNLRVRVDLGGDEHPPARCEADAEKMAAAAIAAAASS